MTEQQWLRAGDPQPMLDILRGIVRERKQRLFAVACCRHLNSRMRHEDRAVLEAAEMFAEGKADQQRLREASVVAETRRKEGIQRDYERRENSEFDSAIGYAVSVTAKVGPDLPVNMIAHSVLVAAYWSGPAGYDRGSINARYAARETERARQIATVRCLFGNPFRSVVLDPAWLAWNCSTVVRIAQAIYDERGFDRLPILADALEEAGCGEAELLSHLRGPEPHAKGCWAIDAILGRA